MLRVGASGAGAGGQFGMVRVASTGSGGNGRGNFALAGCGRGAASCRASGVLITGHIRNACGCVGNVDLHQLDECIPIVCPYLCRPQASAKANSTDPLDLGSLLKGE